MPDILSVALLAAPFSTFSYVAPTYFTSKSFMPGQRVVVPLGNRLQTGVVLEKDNSPPDFVRLKPILWPLDHEPYFTDLQRNLAQELAKRQMESVGRILSSFTPATVKPDKVRYILQNDSTETFQVSAEDLRKMEEKDLARFADCWDRKEMELKIVREKEEVYCFLSMDPPWPVRPGAHKQSMVLDFLWENGPVEKSSIGKCLGPGAAKALSVLASRGIITLGPLPETEDREQVCSSPSLSLTEEQSRSLTALSHALDEKNSAVRLLHGVTGSGKTLVYLHLARKCLDKGRSVLLLCPEVALALQVWKSAREEFCKNPCFLYHGYQGRKKRESTYDTLRKSRKPVIVVGTRSALFLPVPNPGLIIMDEEHDTSFKQEERLVYQAKEVAYFYMHTKQGLLVLGSATPDVKTLHASQKGIFPALTLSQRVSNRPMPHIHIVDLNTDPPEKGGPFSPPCHQALKTVLEKGEQAIILQNRRGYSPLVYCLDCGYVARCSQCDVGLTYHRNLERLICHYCGYTVKFPLICDQCGGCRFLPLGEGTEQIEEFLRETFWGTSILRLDKDTARRAGRTEEILTEFAMAKSQILLGTQMISKGHDFPGVTLVLVVDSDLGLNLPDYRATERTFQLLLQVAGRAGRGELPGNVYLQTRNPGHYCWQYVMKNDYMGFYEQEITRRERLKYPPFVNLALVRMDYPKDWPRGRELVKQTAQVLRNGAKELGVQVLGPSPAPLEHLRGRTRYQALLKGQDWKSIRGVYTHTIQRLSKNSSFRIKLDIDPVSML